jgi:hypothetical protein
MLGLLCIILAHSRPPSFLFQIRNFDVPLMVLVSGALFYLSFRNKKYCFSTYLRTRIPRLIAPVWLFLAFFFGFNYLLYSILGYTYPFSTKEVLENFLFMNGMDFDYVWIIRVFVITAIISAPLFNLYEKCSKKTFLSVITTIYCLYELAYALLESLGIERTSNFFLNFSEQYLFYLIPYGCLCALGVALPRMNKKLLLKIIIIFSTLSLTLALCDFWVLGEFVQTQIFKYPPRLYYLSYAIAISVSAYLVIDNLLGQNNELPKRFSWITQCILFLSSSSLWIYLWHTFWLYYWNNFVQKSFPITNNSIVTFLVVTLLSTATTYLQKQFASQSIQTTRFGQRHARLITTLFLK